MSFRTPNNEINQKSTPGTIGSHGNPSLKKRRFTPYRKTPRTRRVHEAVSPYLNEIEDDDLNVIDQNFSVLLNRTWKCYRVTPLYNFSYSQKALKSYGRFLAAMLQAEYQKGLGVSSLQVNTSASVTIFKGLKQNQDDPAAVLISLKDKGKKGEDKVILEAVLCSVGLKKDLQLPDLQRINFTLLPLMLVKGPQKHSQYVIKWLQEHFDCSISSLQLNSISLSWMLGLWAGQVPEDRKGNNLELVYTLPSEITELNSLTLSFPPENCSQLWRSLQSEKSDKLSYSTLIKFIKALEAHFFHFFKIDLSVLHLSRVGSSVAFVGQEGRLKLYSRHHILPILNYLSETAAEFLQPP